MEPATLFRFSAYRIDDEQKQIAFDYELNNGAQFTEILQLQTDQSLANNELINAIAFQLHIALGMSYWKLYCPTEIEINSGELTKAEADFWTMVYTKGLGEFYYTNHIDFRDLVSFPYADGAISTPQRLETSGVLLPIGGGKDSLTSAMLLQEMEYTFSTFALNRYDVIEQQAEQLSETHHTIERTLDPLLLELNTHDNTYNGHVPISVIYGLTAVLEAAVNRYQYIALSNERSANVGNVEYLGVEMNHQWSKSLEFEQAFQSFIHESLTPDITYFSLLRPFSELNIAELFSEFAAPEFLAQTTSCNRNFTIQKEQRETLWCCECPKCAFTFLMFAPFIEKQYLIRAFGKNLLADSSLLDLYLELLGVKGIKPFDCVGTPEEVAVAFNLVDEQYDYGYDAIMVYVTEQVLPTMKEQLPQWEEEVFSPSADHLLPGPFVTTLESLLEINL